MFAIFPKTLSSGRCSRLGFEKAKFVLLGNAKNVLILSFFAILTPHAVLSQDTETCPKAWSNYVSLIDDLLESNEGHAKPIVFFVGSDGKVFNCLRLEVKNSILANVQEYQYTISRFLHIFSEPEIGGWRPYICNVTVSNLSELRYLAVNLPDTKGLLDLTECFDRVRTSFTRELGHDGARK